MDDFNDGRGGSAFLRGTFVCKAIFDTKIRVSHSVPFFSVFVCYCCWTIPRGAIFSKSMGFNCLVDESVEVATGEKSGFRVRRRWMTRISEISGSTGVSAGAGVDSSTVGVAVSSLGSGASVSLVTTVAPLSEMTETGVSVSCRSEIGAVISAVCSSAKVVVARLRAKTAAHNPVVS